MQQQFLIFIIKKIVVWAKKMVCLPKKIKTKWEARDSRVLYICGAPTAYQQLQ